VVRLLTHFETESKFIPQWTHLDIKLEIHLQIRLVVYLHQQTEDRHSPWIWRLVSQTLVTGLQDLWKTRLGEEQYENEVAPELHLVNSQKTNFTSVLQNCHFYEKKFKIDIGSVIHTLDVNGMMAIMSPFWYACKRRYSKIIIQAIPKTSQVAQSRTFNDIVNNNLNKDKYNIPKWPTTDQTTTINSDIKPQENPGDDPVDYAGWWDIFQTLSKQNHVSMEEQNPVNQVLIKER